MGAILPDVADGFAILALHSSMYADAEKYRERGKTEMMGVRMNGRGSSISRQFFRGVLYPIGSHTPVSAQFQSRVKPFTPEGHLRDSQE